MKYKRNIYNSYDLLRQIHSAECSSAIKNKEDNKQLLHINRIINNE